MQSVAGRLLRHLAISLPLAGTETGAFLGQLPPRLRLQFILYHGDTAWLPLVREQMRNPECARYAGWVWSALTGVDLQANGLTLPARVEEAGREAPTDDLDPGLPLPDAQAVARAAPLPPGGQRTLLGQALDKLDVGALLQRAPQALRWIAARHLERRSAGRIAFDTLAHAREQAGAMQRLAGGS
jgi:hypothetical protein